MLRQNALGMKLYSLDWVHAVPQAHDDAPSVMIPASCRDLQLARKSVFFNDQGVIASAGHGGGDALKNRLAIVFDGAGLAMHQVCCPYDPAAESFADRLMPEADAKYRNSAGEVAYDFNADTRIPWRAWPWRNDNAFRMHIFKIFDCHLVIAAHFDLLPQLANILDQVVGERVIVVEDENHLSTRQSARNAWLRLTLVHLVVDSCLALASRGASSP